MKSLIKRPPSKLTIKMASQSTLNQHHTLQTLQDTSGDNPDALSEALEGSGVTVVPPNREAACSASEVLVNVHDGHETPLQAAVWPGNDTSLK